MTKRFSFCEGGRRSGRAYRLGRADMLADVITLLESEQALCESPPFVRLLGKRDAHRYARLYFHLAEWYRELGA